MNKVINQVFETTDYSIFQKLKGNRDDFLPNIKRLKDSFSKKQLQNPIIVNEKYEIIDGQHRFRVCKELGLPVHYIICTGYTIEEVQTLNSNMKNWSREDYLNAYCESGHEAYLKFRNFMHEFPEFGMASIEALLTQRLQGGQITKMDKVHSTNNSGTIAIKYFQNGDLQIPDIELSREYARNIMRIKPYYDGFHRSIFVRAMIGLFRHQNFDFEVFMKRLESQPKSLYHCTNVGQYKELIEEIYNFRSRNKVSFKY